MSKTRKEREKERAWEILVLYGKAAGHQRQKKKGSVRQ